MAYQTPENDATLVSRVFFIPDDEKWAALFWGVLMTLSDPENWTQAGSLTPEEAAEIWRNAWKVSLDANPNP